MDPQIVFYVLIAFGAVWTIAWLWVLVSTRTSTSYEDIAPKVAGLRRGLFYPLLILAIVAFVGSLFLLPYSQVRARTIGEPEHTVNVQAQQWAWLFDPSPNVPVGKPVEFVVTSVDVNHGFGIYNEQGQLLTQVQAMPGYENRLIYQFDEAGTYKILCLELCGNVHHLMKADLTVE